VNYQINYHPEAAKELVEAFDYYFERSTFAAERFDDEVQRYERQIADDPLFFSSVNGIHRCIMTTYPYTIRYIVSGDNIEILAIAHHRRKPDYWKSRITLH
jgi:plasmid stabilization system protein ParE